MFFGLCFGALIAVRQIMWKELSEAGRGGIGVSKKGRANHFKHNIMAKSDEALGALCGSAPCLIAF